MLGFPTHIVGTPTIRGKAQRYKGSRGDKDRSTSGKEGRSGRGARREERFLSAQADAFAGANAEEKSRPAPFEMTGGGRGQDEEVGSFRSIPQNHPGRKMRESRVGVGSGP